MGRIRNSLSYMADKLERNKDLKGKSLTHLIICMAFDDGHIHAAYPDDKLKTEQMIRTMAQERISAIFSKE